MKRPPRTRATPRPHASTEWHLVEPLAFTPDQVAVLAKRLPPEGIEQLRATCELVRDIYRDGDQPMGVKAMKDELTAIADLAHGLATRVAGGPETIRAAVASASHKATGDWHWCDSIAPHLVGLAKALDAAVAALPAQGRPRSPVDAIRLIAEALKPYGLRPSDDEGSPFQDIAKACFDACGLGSAVQATRNLKAASPD